jgi:DNA-binding response OmpR family regulator
VLRRQELEREAVADRSAKIVVGDIEIEPLSHRVAVAGNDVRLTPSEFKVLLLLAQEPHRVFSRWQIMEHVWDSSYVGTARAADVHISNLRKKLEIDPADPKRILTVREAGYKLARTPSAKR